MSAPGRGALPLSLPPSPPSDRHEPTGAGAPRVGGVGASAGAEAAARGEARARWQRAGAHVAASQPPKCGRLLWGAAVAGCAWLLALASAREVTQLYTVVPLLPAWLAQAILLSAQCSRRQTGRALLPALRTLGVVLM